MMKKVNIIFGCGYYGRAIFRKIKKKNVLFVDNNKKIKRCMNKEVILPEQILKKKIIPNKVYLAGRYIDEQIPLVKRMGLYNKVIIFKNHELSINKKQIVIREKKILKILKELFDEFNKNKINYFIDRSSLLAMIRGQSFAELSDVDISVSIENYNQFLGILKNIAKKFEVKVKGKKIIFKKKKYNQYYITKKANILIEEPPMIDFILRSYGAKKVKSIGIKLNDVKIGHLKEMKYFFYKNLKFLVPKNPNRYLQSIYGVNWKEKNDYYLKSSRI